MIVHHAEAVLPIARPPVRNGWVAIDASRIVACGAGEPAPSGSRGVSPFPDEPFAIMPALVNAHTHIELSYLQGAVPPSHRFDGWIRTLVARRRQYQGTAAAIAAEARAAIRQARAAGTGLIGDVSNTLVTVPLFAEAGIAAHVFYELIGLSTADPASMVSRARQALDALGIRTDIRVSLAPHAPYSVAPDLFRAIRRDLDSSVGPISSVHLAESTDELEFLMNAGGEVRAALEELGAWNPDWTPPGCGPVEYVARLGFLHPQVLVVHGVHLTDGELEQITTAGATIVTCPRSNRWTGAGAPPLERFYASGVRVAIGTDSLASVDDLSVFSELAAARALAREVPAARLLESATRTGAQGLGFGDEFGTLEPGKRAKLIAVRMPRDVADVEEYLLTGIPSRDIRWLSE